MTRLRILLLLAATLAAAKTFDIRDFGATPGANADVAFQKAVEAAAAAGGGFVVVPKGRWRTTGVELKSGVHLRLEEGAVLSGPRYEAGKNPRKGARLVGATFATNVGIEGPGAGCLEEIASTGGRDRAISAGILDGEGESYWVTNEEAKPPKDDWSWASHNAWKALPRPRNVHFFGCADVTIRGVTLRNSPSWTLHLESSDRILVENVVIRNPLHGPNTDGIDINRCRDVTVRGCDISTGDDAICLKSVSKENRSVSRNIMVSNCRIETECQALKIGTETLEGFENVSFRDIRIENPSPHPFERASAGIALETVDGGTVDGVHVSNIRMSDVRAPIFIRLGNRGNGQTGTKKVPGELKNILIEDVRAVRCFTEGSITGIPGHPVRGVVLRDVSIEIHGAGESAWSDVPVPEKESTYPAPRMFGMRLPASVLFVRHVQGLRMENVSFRTLAPDGRPLLVFDDVADLAIRGLRPFAPSGDRAPLLLRDVNGADLEDCPAPAGVKTFLRIEGGGAASVRWNGGNPDLIRREAVGPATRKTEEATEAME